MGDPSPSRAGFAVEPPRACPVPRGGSTDVPGCPQRCQPRCPGSVTPHSHSVSPSSQAPPQLCIRSALFSHPLVVSSAIPAPPWEPPGTAEAPAAAAASLAPGRAQEQQGTQGTRGRAVPHQSSRSAAGTQSVPDPDPTAKDAGLGAERSWGPSGAASSVPREDTPSPGSAAMAMGRARCSEPRVTRVSHQEQNCPPVPGHSSLSCWSLAQKLLPMGLGKPWDDERPGTVSCLSFPLVKSSLPTL